MSDEKNTPKLSDALKDKFKMAKNFAPGKYTHRGANIDLTITDLETVELAVKNGFDVVVPISTTKQNTPVK